MAFSFRLRVVAPPGHGLTESGQRRISIDTPRWGTIELHAKTPEKADRKSLIVITGREYSSADEARRAGEAARWALRIAGVSANVPLDLGNDRATSGMARAFREEQEQRFGIQIRNDVHGLDVYEEDDRPVKYISMEARPSVTASVDKFAQALRAGFARHEGAGRPSYDEAAALAMDLYLLAGFETSERARFLTLITALEVLSVREQQRPKVLSFVDQTISRSRTRCGRSWPRPIDRERGPSTRSLRPW